MYKLIQVKPLEKYKLWLKFSDGTEGDVDLSSFAGKGVFAIWDQKNGFENVQIGEAGELCWGHKVDLCPDSLYLKLTKKHPEDIFPNLTEDHCA